VSSVQAGVPYDIVEEVCHRQLFYVPVLVCLSPLLRSHWRRGCIQCSSQTWARLIQMEEVNPEFGDTDVALVIGTSHTLCSCDA
jgi:hypothetical protein